MKWTCLLLWKLKCYLYVTSTILLFVHADTIKIEAQFTLVNESKNTFLKEHDIKLSDSPMHLCTNSIIYVQPLPGYIMWSAQRDNNMKELEICSRCGKTSQPSHLSCWPMFAVTLLHIRMISSLNHPSLFQWTASLSLFSDCINCLTI